MKIFIIFTVLSSHIFFVTGQSISSFTINSTGKTLTSTQNALTFTVGELATGKYTSSQTEVYQGFIVPQDLFVTSIQDLNKFEIKFWPNPTTGWVNIITETTNAKFLKVFDKYGRLIIDKPYQYQELDLSTQTNGIYFIQLFGDGYRLIKTFTVIKQ